MSPIAQLALLCICCFVSGVFSGYVFRGKPKPSIFTNCTFIVEGPDEFADTEPAGDQYQ